MCRLRQTLFWFGVGAEYDDDLWEDLEEFLFKLISGDSR